MLQELYSESLAVWLKNVNKLKVMLSTHAESAPFSPGNEVLEKVDEYNYLGQIVSADPNHGREIRCRITMGWRAFGKRSEQ